MRSLFLEFVFCTFFCLLVDGIELDVTPRALVLALIKQKYPIYTDYKGMSELLSLLERSSLLDFIRLKRCRTFRFDHYYRPSDQRLNDHLALLIKGKLPLSVANELIGIKLLSRNDKALKTLLENPLLMEKLRLTNKFPSATLSHKTISMLVAFIVKRQYRKVYKSNFYDLLEDEVMLLNRENWEFFDFLFMKHLGKLYKEDYKLDLVSLLIPMAKVDDFAFFRLNIPFIKADGEDLFDLTKDEYFRDLRTLGTPIQKTIITLGDRLTSKSHLQKDCLVEVPSAAEISQVYYHFKKLLELKQDDSPAFLLELLATTISINTRENALELLTDLVSSYPLERISPYHLNYTVGYFSEVARNFCNSRIKQGEEWENLLNDRTFMFYLPPSALTREELLPLWSSYYTLIYPPNIERVNGFFNDKDHEGVMKIVNGEFRFFCDGTYNHEQTKEFILAGLDLTSLGSFDFLSRLPKCLHPLIYELMKIGSRALPSDLEVDKGFISQICVNPETAIPESVKGILTNLKAVKSLPYMSRFEIF